MAVLYSRYISGTQVLAGVITGSTMGMSGLNLIVDRLNSISSNNNHITGSVISGTSIVIRSGSIINNCFVITSWSSNPVDNIQGRLWINI